MMISVVIPNWNGQHHLEECLLALRRQSYQDFEVILVDNGSADGSVAYAQDRFPEVKIIELGGNLGFAAAVNAGIRAAKGDYVTLLNNDTEADARWLESLHAAISAHPDTAIFASLLANYYERSTVDSAGDGMNLRTGPYKLGEKQPVHAFQVPKRIFGACGGGGCYRRDIFEQIGYFDEDFFAYFEDADLSFRANWAGLTCLFVPEAVIFHKVGGTSTINQTSRDRFDIMRRRNYIFLVVKNYPVTFLLRWLPSIFFRHTLKFLHHMLCRRFKVAFLIQWEIVKGLPGMLVKRHAILNNRRITNTEMKSRCQMGVVKSRQPTPSGSAR